MQGGQDNTGKHITRISEAIPGTEQYRARRQSQRRSSPGSSSVAWELTNTSPTIPALLSLQP